MSHNNIHYIFLPTLLMLYLHQPTNCMNIYSGDGRCVINGQVFYGNSVVIINGKTYVDGVLQGQVAHSSAAWTHKSEKTMSIPLNNNARVMIENIVGDIDVLSHNEANAKLIITKLGATEDELQYINASINQNQNTLQIITKQSKDQVQAIINYQLLLPAISAFLCNFANSSGKISVKEVNGQLTTTSISGKTSLQKIAGPIQTKTTSGDIKLITIKGPITITTTSGTTNAKEIMGLANFKSSSGDIKIDTVSDQTEVTTIMGTLTIKNIAAMLLAQSSSGDMRISNISSNFNGTSISGTITAKGITGSSTIKTSSGDITSNTTGEFRGNSISGTIKLYKKDINAPISIKTSSGDIEIQSNTFNAMLKTEMSSGELSSDFAIPIKKQKHGGRSNLSAQVGNGGPVVSLTTISGDITLTQN